MRQRRRQARYPENADLHNRLRERRFDLDPNVILGPPSQHETGKAAFDALPEPNRAALLNWLDATIKPARPTKGAEWTPYKNVLRSAQLAEQAADALGFPVDLAAMRGALLAAGYLPLRAFSDRPAWLIGATYRGA